MNDQPTPETMAFIARHEGKNLNAYRDTRGFWTWGIGCRITDPLLCEALDNAIPFSLSEPQSAGLFIIALSHAALNGSVLFPELETYAPARQTALVSLLFQLGPFAFSPPNGFKNLYSAVLQNDWTRAADELYFKNPTVSQDPSDYSRQCPERCAETARMLNSGSFAS